MTTDTWFPIPNYSKYEINRDGNVRLSDKAPIISDHGKLITCYTSKNDNYHLYDMVRDDGFSGWVDKQELLDATF